MSFLAPLILVGLGLVTIPWLIHLIRRPEREEVRFGSLMFVPRITKEIIERRKLQHILLMLLRMLLVALLALAFSRPFFPVSEQTVVVNGNAARHLIMLDTSYSMNFGSGFDQAIEIARGILTDIPETEDVGIAVFGETPRMLFSPESEGGRSMARSALNDIKPVWEATNYHAALQFGENRLLSGLSGDAPKNHRLYLHMISDFQKAGTSETEQPWRLSGLISFESYPVKGEPQPNLSLTEVGIRGLDDGGFVISGKVKNWTSRDVEQVPVKLFLEGKEVDHKAVTVNAANATRVSFQVTGIKTPFISGRLEIGGDGFEPDNRRYFVWRPRRALNVILVADDRKNESYPAQWFIATALEKICNVTRRDQTEWLASADGINPDLVIVCDINDFQEDTGRALLDFAEKGGRLLFTMDHVHNGRTAMDGFLSELGLEHRGVRFEEMLPSRHDSWSRVAFDHPVFSPFQGARFNDFSQLRFNNYHLLNLKVPEKVSVMARFANREDGGISPACIDVPYGNGRFVIWAFTPNLEWTNLTKDIKFVPLLHETIFYLAGREREIKPYLTGQAYDLAQWPDQAKIELPGAGSPVRAGSENALLSEAGFIRLRPGDGQPDRIVDAVNLDTRESDPERYEIREFVLKLTSSTPKPENRAAAATRASEQLASKNEVGWFILIAVAFFLIVETWYAARLSKQRTATATGQAYFRAPSQGGI